VKLSILGPVRLLMHGPVEVGATKVRGLLGFLSYKANEPVHVDRIAEALWDGDAPADTGKALQTYASRLRRVFRDAHCPAALTNEHRSYRLDIDRSTVDYHRFASLVQHGHRARGSGNPDAAANLFAAALALWSGPFLADLDTPWARRFRDALTTRDYIPAQCALFDTRLSLGDHEFVLAGLPPLLSDHPTDERLATRWVRALASANRADEVPVFYRDFAGRLYDELAVQPSEELTRTCREVMTRRPAHRPGPPRDIPYFTGRDGLLAQLDALLTAEDRTVDVVALDGPPGIGKTTLVRHWARSRQPRFPGGVLHVDLAGYSEAPVVDPHAVLAMFLAELGVNSTEIPETTNERAALLRHLLATRATLIFLDNARDSTHVRPLLDATSPCPALITSRQRLTGITYRDGVQLSIPALPPDEATALLAKRIGPRAHDDPAALATLVELCQGLPLALRIVGEHVAMRPAAPIGELANELRHTKRLLDAGWHDDHTTTLRSTFSLSYRALQPAPRRLFRLLGLHPGTRFSIHAVSAVAGVPPDDVAHQLDALIGAHLVDQEGAGRYCVHDLLHTYAADIVREEEPHEDRARATHRLFDWYLRNARHARTHLLSSDQGVPELASVEPVAQLTFATRNEALDWFVTERANLVACTYRAADLGFHEHVWRFAACLNVLGRLEDPRDLLDIHELARRSAELLGDTAAVGGCLNNKGAIHLRLHEEEDAARCFDLAAREFTKAGDQRGLAVFTHNTGALRLQLGQPAEAITWLTKALTMRGATERNIAKSHLRLGDAYLMLDRLDEARSHYRQSLYASQKAADAAGEARSLSKLARLNLDENRLEDAVRYGEAALAAFDRAQVDQDGATTALIVLATAHLRRGAPSPAAALAREAVDGYLEIRNVSGQIDGLILLGRAQAASGELTEATSTWLAAELITPPTDPRGDVIRGLLVGTRPVPAPRTEDAMGGQSPVREISEDVG
jgi:DNA-binding SARP family transcriptional activator/tetratricopeptide (TPR) repeat protein